MRLRPPALHRAPFRRQTTWTAPEDLRLGEFARSARSRSCGFDLRRSIAHRFGVRTRGPHRRICAWASSLAPLAHRTHDLDAGDAVLAAVGPAVGDRGLGLAVEPFEHPFDHAGVDG